jgi:chromate transporter
MMQPTSEASLAAKPTLGEMFAAFLKIGLLGFGGVAAQARHVIVLERRWLDDAGYATLIGACQGLPGANTVNAAVILGDQFRGPAGAAVCVVGLMAAPLVILLAAAYAYAAGARYPLVHAALGGAAAAAAGVLAGTALKLAWSLRASRLGLAIAVLGAIAVGVFRWPLIWVALGLIALSVAASAWEARRAR